jgi:hypothetical protein
MASLSWRWGALWLVLTGLFVLLLSPSSLAKFSIDVSNNVPGYLYGYSSHIGRGAPAIFVNGQPIDEFHTPTIKAGALAIRVVARAPVNVFELAVRGDEVVRWAVHPDPRGEAFESTAPETFPPGAYTLYANDEIAGNLILE